MTSVTDRPAVTPPQPWAFPEASRSALDNGLNLVTYDVPGQYVISLRLAVPLPLSLEPRGKEGLATILSRTLDEGTEQHSAEEFAELLERKGIALGAGTGEAGLTVELEVSKRHLSDALDLLSQAVREPVFPEAEVTRHVRTRLAEIDQEHANPTQRAALELVRTYFAPGERAALPSAGTRETVSGITREDLVAFHAAHVAPGGSTLVVTGDLSGLDVAAEVAATLGSWSGQAAVTEPVASARAADAGRTVFVDRPGAVQSEITIACAGPDRREEGGWAPFPVLSFVIGGSPNARIDAVLREEKGFTYGIRSGFRPRRKGGLFLTGGSVRADSTVEALDLLLGILDGGRDGFTEEEARAGVDFIGKTAPGRYATADAVADEAATMALEGLTTDFTTANLLDLATVDAARISEAYRRHVQPGQWTVVVVGDAGRYAEGVRALGRGEVSVVPN
ncbi:M16 family metallopeptidase [Oryzihumus sp.]